MMLTSAGRAAKTIGPEANTPTIRTGVSADLSKLSTGAEWRAFFEGLYDNGSLGGWAFCAAAPERGLTLDLYLHGIRIATTLTDLERVDLSKILRYSGKLKAGFRFSLENFDPAGALAALRYMRGRNPLLELGRELQVRIGGTSLEVPFNNKTKRKYLDFEKLRPSLSSFAVEALRAESEGERAPDLGLEDQALVLSLSPLFSPSWYTDRYEDVDASGFEPADHYLRLGAAEHRDPGPWFDSAAYLEAVPAARESNLAPLVHYIFYGQDSWWPGAAGLDRKPVSDNRDHALVIHIYHLDTAYDLAYAAEQFPEDTDVFVTVPDTLKSDDFGGISALFPNAEIIPVANRGQDIGPFFEVVRRLKGRGYKTFCKLHSKKGNKYPDIWRRNMIDSLGAGPERISHVLHLMRSEPRVVLAGPKAFWFEGGGFAYGNAPMLKNLLNRAGFAHAGSPRDWGFFGGTCFWIDAALAEILADAVPSELFDEDQIVLRNGQVAHAAERLFGAAVSALGGKVALLDGHNWLSPPVVIEGGQETLKAETSDEAHRTLLRTLRELDAPRTLSGQSLVRLSPLANPSLAEGIGPDDEIDVMACCWSGAPEKLHYALPVLNQALAKAGLTVGYLISSSKIQELLESHSCRHVFPTKFFLDIEGFEVADMSVAPARDIPVEVERELLAAECLFRKCRMPKGADLDADLARIRKVVDAWRRILDRRKVKLLLIWGDTAPKSRMFLYLCREMGIEFLIIERGHFAGTLTYDPTGQFGRGARPQILEPSESEHSSENIGARFDRICTWYNKAPDEAYSLSQRRSTPDLERISRARQTGRRVILVIGANDQGTGIAQPSREAHRTNWFGSSDQAFKMIIQMAQSYFPDALLVLRPHPSQSYEGEAPGVLTARDSALDLLIDASDVCICIATTAHAICLLRGKPVISLGLTELTGTGVVPDIVDETALLSQLRRALWSEGAGFYPDDENQRFIVRLFERQLIAVEPGAPAGIDIHDFANHLITRLKHRLSGFLLGSDNVSEINRKILADVRRRGRVVFRADPRGFLPAERPKMSVVLPIYGDYEGTRLCFELLERHQKRNGYRVIAVWDRGPDVRLRELCLDYAERNGFSFMENHENVGFSGAVNEGILMAGRDDVILLNSDTVPCDDWALRLQDAAYSHPKIGAVVPFSNSATIYNLPFPNGMPLSQDEPVGWIEALDAQARKMPPDVVEMPISHGYCTYVRRSIFDRIGLYSESKFGKGHGEDNEFSMRMRMAGYFCGAATNVVVGHAGSTSFGDEAMEWKLRGRTTMNAEFPHYFEEIRDFFQNDPLATHRARILDGLSGRDEVPSDFAATTN